MRPRAGRGPGDAGSRRGRRRARGRGGWARLRRTERLVADTDGAIPQEAARIAVQTGDVQLQLRFGAAERNVHAARSGERRTAIVPTPALDLDRLPLPEGISLPIQIDADDGAGRRGKAPIAATRLLSRLDDEAGAAIRARSLDAASQGVRRQAELRVAAGEDGYAEDNLWTGIGRARSGCGAAIVGDPDQVLAKIEAYRALGLEAFILSGYPHAAEADLFARYVLPRLNHGPLEIA